MEPPVYKRLFAEPFIFDFFQASRLLGRLPDAQYRLLQSMEDHSTAERLIEPARYRSHLSLAFPASAVHDLQPPTQPLALPVMTVTFFGLYGPSGVLPRHYTELMLRLEREVKGAERNSLRDWLDLFNHRLIYLFYRAWDKYRFWLAYERGEPNLADPDPFTRCLLALSGLATGGLRNRLRVVAPPPPATTEWRPGDVPTRPVYRRDAYPWSHEQADPGVVLNRINDLGLLRFAGLFATRHRNASGLRALLSLYFSVPIEIRQYQGQWLPLDQASQSRLPGDGALGQNCELGVNAVAGSRVWDVQGRFRIRVGPLNYQQFLEYMPDRTLETERKANFMTAHLAQLYAGPAFDFDIQMVLKAEDVPECRLAEHPAPGPRLGWNCWLITRQPDHPAEDAIFEAEPIVRLESL